MGLIRRTHNNIATQFFSHVHKLFCHLYINSYLPQFSNFSFIYINSHSFIHDSPILTNTSNDYLQKLFLKNKNETL